MFHWPPTPGTGRKIRCCSSGLTLRAPGTSWSGSGGRRPGIVYTSTVVVFGPTPRGVVGNEEMPRATPRFLTEFEESKAVAEKEALELTSRGFPIVVVHPTRVYGPGKLTEGNTVSLMIDQYDRGGSRAARPGRELGNYALVDDLVEGQVLAMEKGKVAEHRSSAADSSLKGLLRLVDESTQRRHFQVSLPRSVSMFYAALEKRKANWYGVTQDTPGG